MKKIFLLAILNFTLTGCYPGFWEGAPPPQDSASYGLVSAGMAGLMFSQAMKPPPPQPMNITTCSGNPALITCTTM